MAEIDVEANCAKYPRMGLYWLVTAPYAALLLATAVYLWQFSAALSVVYLSLYVGSVVLHGYVCAFSGCPYKGTMCPGAFGYAPVGKMALLFDRLGAKESRPLMGAFFFVVVLALLGIILLPLYWLAQAGIGWAVGYVSVVLVYFGVFVVTICPRCSMRSNCPVGRLSGRLRS